MSNPSQDSIIEHLKETKKWAYNVLNTEELEEYDTSSFYNRISKATNAIGVQKIVRDLKKEYVQKKLEGIVANSSKTHLHDIAKVALKQLTNTTNNSTINNINTIAKGYNTLAQDKNHAKPSQNTLLFTGSFIFIGIIAMIISFTLKPGSGFRNMNETEINPVTVMTVILLIILFVLIWSK